MPSTQPPPRRTNPIAIFWFSLPSDTRRHFLFAIGTWCLTRSLLKLEGGFYDPQAPIYFLLVSAVLLIWHVNLSIIDQWQQLGFALLLLSSTLLSMWWAVLGNVSICMRMGGTPYGEERGRKVANRDPIRREGCEGLGVWDGSSVWMAIVAAMGIGSLVSILRKWMNEVSPLDEKV
jgi:hypothetical protein